MFRFKWDLADAEPLAFGRRLSRMDVESSQAIRSAGVREAARREGFATESRDLLASGRKAKTRRRNISRRERARSSDEAIVSDDATGQNNPTPSQGPLDRCAWTDFASTPTQCGDCPMGYCERDLKKLGRHISPQGRRLPLTTGLKPYWGKPAVRNFREGRGNVMHGLMPTLPRSPKGRIQRKALAYTSARLISTRRTVPTDKVTPSATPK